MNMDNCKLVQDLLPNYMEGLTTIETNKYIENHLKECRKCNSIFERMKLDIQQDPKVETKEINYLKKYSKKLKTLKIILMIILILILLWFARNIVIIMGMQNKISQYSEINNYYLESCTYQGQVMSINKSYVKDSFSKSLTQHIDENTNKKLTTYRNGDTTNLYIEAEGSKKAILNQKQEETNFTISNGLETQNWYEMIVMAITSKIDTENCNGKECYKIETSNAPNIIYSEGGKVTLYLDKKTGLLVRQLNEKENNEKGQEISSVQDYFYEFGQVTTEDLKEPELTQYEIKQAS